MAKEGNTIPDLTKRQVREQLAERGLGDDVRVERNISPTSAVNEIVLVILDAVVEGDAMVGQGVAFQR